MHPAGGGHASDCRNGHNEASKNGCLSFFVRLSDSPHPVKSAPKHDEWGRAGSKACPTCCDTGTIGADECKCRKMRNVQRPSRTDLAAKCRHKPCMLWDSILRSPQSLQP